MPRPAPSFPRTVTAVGLVCAVIIGAALGVAMGSTRNIAENENFTEFRSALPTKILDIKGRLITEFFSEEKRSPVSIKDLPDHLVNAVLTREDRDFFRHRGFTLKSILRAAWGVMTGNSLGGGSTITQQLAGSLYADRREISLKRKFVELWWALQMERRFTKEEILEMYLNRMIMGSGVYGVEAASQYLFGHPAGKITVAEAAILSIQLSSPVAYDPYRNPNRARARSREILDQMIGLGFAEKSKAEESFAEYWDNFDYTRVAAGAYFMRDDKAPWFSEYVRRQLEDMLYGSLDLYSDGFTVHTTLDLDQQVSADAYMERGIRQANAGFKRSSSMRLTQAENTFVPIVELLGLTFNLKKLTVSDAKAENNALSYFKQRLNPAIDAASLLFGLPDLKALANTGSTRLKTDIEKSTVEGALITVANDTGYITSMVGGSKFEMSNQLIRATQATLMPGSTFKPLYYSAAIDSGKVTEGTMIYDAPTVFYNEDGTPYIPLNFMGEWKGPVLAWKALAKSMNVASVKILDTVGFDAAIDRAAALLDIKDPDEKRKTFPRVYPLGLGVIGVSPARMARAFAVFANGGREVTPIAIRSVEDRYGNVILDPERELREKQARKGQDGQVVSPRNAAVMTDMLERVVASGTLSGQTGSGSIFRQTDEKGKQYTIPAAGKTGTTVNWADAWTVGFTPYFTTAIWFGFDRPGNSLGVDQTGATLAGTIWSDYMRDIHKGMPYKDFPNPGAGLARASVCAVSGLVPTEFCNEGTVSLLYYEGSQPARTCDIHTGAPQGGAGILDQITDTSLDLPDSGPLGTPTTRPAVDSSLTINLPGFDLGTGGSGGSSTTTTSTGAARTEPPER